MKIKFINAIIVTVNEKFEVINGGELLVEDNIIKQLGKSGSIKENADKVIDCNGNILMPGLINTHSHAAMTLFKGFGEGVVFEDWWIKRMKPLEDKLVSQDIYNGASLAIKEMLSNGITTFFDCYFDYDQTIKAANDLGIRVGVAFGAISGNDEVTIEKLENEYERLSKFENVIPFVYAHSTYSCDEFQFATLVKMAKRHNLVFSTHISETLREVGECHNKHGVTPVGLLEEYGVFDVPCVLAHCVHCDKDDIEIMKKYDVTVAHNPASNLKLGSGIAPLYSFLKNGLNVSLGTDGAASNNNLDMLKEMYLAGVLQFGILNDASIISAEQLIKMATVNGAKAFKQNKIGVLQKGNFADIILIDTHSPNMQPLNNVINNLAFSVSSKNVLMTMVNGKIVYDNFTK